MGLRPSFPCLPFRSLVPLSYLPSKTMGCFSGRLMSAASDQKLFCKLCSPFCCSFNEFAEEKVITRPIPPPSWLRPSILLFLGKCLHTFKSQFTCLWPVCLSLPPICSCFLWVSKGLYANSYSHASHSWVIIFYSFIPQTFVKLPECFRHYPRSLGIQQRTS